MDMTLADAGYSTSLYFLFRTLGCFSGAIILARFSAKKFFIISVASMVIAVGGLYFGHSLLSLYICVALIGFGNSNVFSIMFSQALLHLPQRNNEISGLMVMGISGGAVFPLLMGIASDALSGQIGAVIVLTICVMYLVVLAPKIK